MHERKQIEGWKRLLLHKSEMNKIKAAEQILGHIDMLEKRKKPQKTQLCLELLMDEDYLELICNTMQTSNFKLMRNMYSLLKHFLKLPNFFEYHRVVYVLETLMRNVHVFYKTKPKSTVLTLKLLSDIISNDHYPVVKDAYDAKDLLTLLMKLNSNLEYYRKIKSSTQKLTYSLLHHVSENVPKKLNIDHLKILSFNVLVSLYKEIEECESEAGKKEKAYFMCKLMTKFLNFFKLDGEKDPHLVKHIMNSCTCLASFPRMKHCESPLALRICRFFIAVAKNSNKNFVRYWLAEFLATNGFLMFFLQHFQAFRSNAEASRECSRVLEMIIVNLSRTEEQNPENIKNFIRVALSGFPATSSCALELEKPYFSNTQMAIITIIYYHHSLCTFSQEEKLMITSGSPSMNKVLLRESTILKLITYVTESTSPIFLKMMIFLFALSSTDSKMKSSELLKNKGYQNLVKLINSTPNLDDLYTDHKALIQWIFSSSSEKISIKFKICAISKWLSSREEDTLLDKIVDRNSQGLRLLLVMLRTCKEEVLRPLYGVLRKVQMKQSLRKEKTIKTKIWNNLPQAIDCYCSNPKTGLNLAAFLKLASTEYSELNTNLMFRITNRILKVLHTQSYNLNVILLVATFSFVKTLMCYFIKMGEERGMLIFFKTIILSNMLKMTVFSENFYLSCASADLILFISKVQESNAVESDTSIKISLETLRQESSKTMLHSLNCIKIYFGYSKIKNVKPFIDLEAMPEENRQKLCCKLYLNFLSLSFTVNETGGEIYWRSMKQLLKSADTEEGSQCLHLWTASTISMLLTRAGDQAFSKEMLLFSSTWLTQLTPIVWRWSHLYWFIYKSLVKQIEETATVLATRIISVYSVANPDTKKRNSKNDLKIHKSISRSILNLQVELPDGINENLQKITDSL